MKNKAEKQYAKLLDDAGKHYIYQPRSSILWSFGYIPDFYIEGEGYIEVIGSRQAFSQGRNKIEKAKGLVELAIVKPDGTPYKTNSITNTKRKTRKEIMEHNSISKGGGGKSSIFVSFDITRMMQDYQLEPKELASLLGVNPTTIYNFIKDNRIRIKSRQLLKSKGYDIEKYNITV